MTRWLLLLSLTGCRKPEPGPPRPLLWPFPNAELMADGRVAIPADALPLTEDGTPFPVERVNGRAGFSPVQTAVIDLGFALSAEGLPRSTDAVPDPDAAVQVWDLDTGEQLPAMAELDASPERPDGEPSALLVRPLRPWPLGHTVAVALRGALQDEAGQPLSPVPWFQALLEDRPGEGLEDRVEHYQDLASRLESLGVTDLVLAFDFPVGAGDAAVQALIAGTAVPEAWSWDWQHDADEATLDLPLTWRQASGSFTVEQWLDESGALQLDGPLGQGEAPLYVHIPESVRDAAPGTAPVWIFGHGIFSAAADYLGEPDDPSGVLALADQAGAIVVASRWDGLSDVDYALALGTAGDYGRLPQITDRLSQSVARFYALSRLVQEGALLDDPVFDGLADPDSVFYYGISLGSIEGAVLLAHTENLPYAVLHVGGSAWSTMLERSYVWSLLEAVLAPTLPSATERQLLYSAGQLLWDPVDPGAVAESLRGRSILWQESMGDEFVPNLSTDLLMRGVGATLLSPEVEPTSGLSAAPGPLQGPAVVQLDPQLGRPADTNRPPERSGAHFGPRVWPGTRAQTARFLDPAGPGVVESFCGDAACTAENPG